MGDKKRKAPDTPLEHGNEFTKYTRRASSNGQGSSNSDDQKTPVPSSDQMQFLTQTPASIGSVSHQNGVIHWGNYRSLATDKEHAQIYQQPEIKKVLDSVNSGLHEIVEKVVNDVETEEETVMSGLQTAALIDVLKVLNASNQELEEIGESARKGATHLLEGSKMIADGKQMVKQAFDQMRKYIKILPTQLQLKFN